MKSSAHLVCLYSLFAALAIMVNIGTQMLFVSAFPFAYSVKISVLPGTCCGLITKYWLDKRYIFCFKTRGFTHDGQRFFVYTLMGLATTAIFWGTEYFFQIIFKTDFMRYTGGIIGLIAGYLIKYRLDKRFVFVSLKTKDNC